MPETPLWFQCGAFASLALARMRGSIFRWLVATVVLALAD
jgi:hypothetical protein